MKKFTGRILLILLILMSALSTAITAQNNLLGNWKYSSPQGGMIMQINPNNILINNQTFNYKIENNALQILEANGYVPYPYVLNGNQLSIVFPGGMEIRFTREATAPQPAGRLPLSMKNPDANVPGSPQSSPLTGRWICQSNQGEVVLEFISGNQLVFNGESTQYQLQNGIIQAMGDNGWINYPYTLNQGQLLITFPDGSQIPFTRSTSPGPQTGMGTRQQQQQAGGNNAWQLQGSLCFWSGSSGSYSSYSRSEKVSFDGSGNFIFGREGSFSGDAGLAYSGNANADRGTYRIEGDLVYMRFQSGETVQVKIKRRQNDGKITALEYQGKLYAPELCD